MALLDEPWQFVAMQFDNPLIHKLIRGERERFGQRQLKQVGSAKEILKHLKAGGNVSSAADINVGADEGVFVPFFGSPACTTVSVALFALRSRAPILPMFLIWNDSASRYRLVIGELIEPVESFDRARNIYEITKTYTGEIEKMIRRYPDQWLWVLRRWKNQPPGGTSE